MVAMVLVEPGDVRAAREWAVLLAQAAGVAEPEMVEQAVAEIVNNCLEHRDGAGPAVLWFGCRRGKLVLRAENVCRERPTWQTSKPELLEGFRSGGYGLTIIRAIAREARFFWRNGRAVVRAEFA